MFNFSNTNKRYHTFNFHLKEKFGEKVFKVSLNASFTCPNIDGSKGFGGCTYCSFGSGDFGGNPDYPIKAQFDEVKKRMHKKWPQAKYIAYFQAGTNTYAPLETLKKLFEEVLTYENVVGISIATRADCLSTPLIEYLYTLHQRTYLIIELGLQTIHDETGIRINRCHSYADFLKGYTKLKEKGLNICVHLINGLPLETKQMMLDSVKTISLLSPHSVKLHLLHILSGTHMAKEYQNNDFDTLSLEEYVDIVCDQIELLRPSIIIQRITGDADKEKLVAPIWSLKKFVTMNEIDKELYRRNSFQGKFAE